MHIEGNQITLKVAGHSVKLIEVLSIKHSQLKIDLVKLKNMVDSPTGLPDGEETTEARADRLLARKECLIKQKVKNPIVIIMQEEGLSNSGVRAIIKRAKDRQGKKEKALSAS